MDIWHLETWKLSRICWRTTTKEGCALPAAIRVRRQPRLLLHGRARGPHRGRAEGQSDQPSGESTSGDAREKMRASPLWLARPVGQSATGRIRRGEADCGCKMFGCSALNSLPHRGHKIVRSTRAAVPSAVISGPIRQIMLPLDKSIDTVAV